MIEVLNTVLSPLVVIATLWVCVLAWGERFSGEYLVLAVLAFFISAQALDNFDLFTPWRTFELTRVARRLLVGWAIVVGILVFLAYATQLAETFDRSVILAWFVATPFALFGALKVARVVVRRRIAGGTMTRSAIVVGASGLGLELARKLREDLYLSMSFAGFFDDRAPSRLDGVAEGELLGRIEDVPRFVKAHGINLVYLSLPMAAQPRIVALIDSLRDTTASVYFVPDLFVFDLVQARFEDLHGIPVVAICETPLFGVNALLKRALDVVASAAILLLIWPVMLAIAIGVKMSSPGPVLFVQRRYGMNGEEIPVFKFRSMTVCEDGGSVVQARRDDPRVTPFGAFLRRTSLDELPQFLNVLRGTMSIVGPRPHAVAHNEEYRALIKGYMVRHKVKPGITGWAQVNGLRGETDTVDKMRRRVELDLDYLRNWSISLDVWIILRTIVVVWRQRNVY